MSANQICRQLGHAAVFGVLALLTIGCGQTSTSDQTSTSAATTEGDSGQLRVMLTGVVKGSTLCPGDTRPCATLDGDLSIDGEPLPVSDPVSVTGTLANGVLTVEEIAQQPSTLDWMTNRCDDKKTEAEFLEFASTSPEDSGIEEGGDLEDYDQLGLYQLSIPDSYAVRWLSPQQVIHLGVVGDATPHQEALAELGLDEYVCVVGGFKYASGGQGQIIHEIGLLVSSWPAAQSWSIGWNPFIGSYEVDLHQADAAMIAEADSQWGDSLVVNASILILNGSFADYDAAIVDSEPGAGSSAGDVPTADSLGLAASCGSVVFPTLPPEPDSFEPIDAEIEAVLDEFATGPLSVESADFVPAYSWSIASRTDSNLVLFGQSDDGEYAVANFEQRDGLWQASGWGGCNIEFDAPGFGPALTVLDPDRQPDPSSTELPILIKERECASGQAPDDRQVVPVVIETDRTVEITTLVEPVAGGADCQGNPWHPITVTLDQPLGDRIVLDGQSSPAEERSWPPSETDLNN